MYLSLFHLILFINAINLATCDYTSDYASDYPSDYASDYTSDYASDSDIRNFNNFIETSTKPVIVRFCEMKIELKLLPGGDRVNPNHEIQIYSQPCDSYHMKGFLGNWSLVQVSANVGGITEFTANQSPEWISLP
jgi:hypothetical protein